MNRTKAPSASLSRTCGRRANWWHHILTTTQPRATSCAEHHDSAENTRSLRSICCLKPCWCLIFFETGLASGVTFLVAMLVYDAAIFARDMSPIACSWLYFCGALLFILESIIDMFWISYIQRARRYGHEPIASIRQGADAGRAMLEIGSDTSSCCTETGASPLPDRWLDRINYDLWAAVFFFLPSVCTLFQALVDANVVGSRTCNFLAWASVSDYRFSVLCGLASQSLYVADGLICLVGRWRLIKNTPLDQRLTLFSFRKTESFAHLDWALWGDMFFLIGAIFDSCEIWSSSRIAIAMSDISDLWWTLDALLYIMAGITQCRRHSDVRNHAHEVEA
eukprot:gnl/TRDRNA2_/TRDRNA2_62923_c0_seq1.p1 gnl/TRDRNA2_/TRDRNA2_62923_c0~~gnl/TRDRNA2_/TRDRNA2_62923_c0_seq1.p1  ORF type:complete len:337 (-),score=12.12 gnl/TRDRNA2_/TRDRNA2_62923_c0_seq1:641-1651(-)